MFTFKATDYYSNREDIIVAEDDICVSGLFLERANWNLKRKGIADSLLGKILVKI